MITAPVVLVSMLASAMAFAAYAPIERAEVSSSEESSSVQAPEWIDSWSGNIVFNTRPSYNPSSVRVVTLTQNQTIQLDRGELFYPTMATYSTSEGLQSVTFGVESFEPDDPYSALRIPTDGAYYPFIFLRGDEYQTYDQVWFYGYLPCSNIPSETYTTYDNRAMTPFFRLDIDGTYTPAYSYWTYIETLCVKWASDILNNARTYQQTAYEYGYQQGVSVATDGIYENGYREGYAEGYSEGKVDGRIIGYNEGKSAVSSSATGIMTLFGSIANIPISVLNGIGSLVIFDVPIIQIMATFLIIALFMWVIKKVV